MAKGVRKTVRLSVEMASAIDRARGDVSWSRWVERALEKALGDGSIGDGPVGVQAGSMPARSPAPSRPSASPLADRQAALNKAKGL